MFLPKNDSILKLGIDSYSPNYRFCGMYWVKAIWNEYLNEHLTIPFFFFHSLTSNCHDDASRFVRLLSAKNSQNYLVSEDFIPLLQVMCTSA